MKKFSKNPYAIKERSSKDSRRRRRLSTPDEMSVACSVAGTSKQFKKVNEVVKWIGGWEGRTERSILEDPDPDVRGDYYYVQGLMKVGKRFVSVAQAVALSGWARACLLKFQDARKRNSALDSKMAEMDEQDKQNPTPGVRNGI